MINIHISNIVSLKILCNLVLIKFKKIDKILRIKLLTYKAFWFVYLDEVIEIFLFYMILKI